MCAEMSKNMFLSLSPSQKKCPTILLLSHTLFPFVLKNFSGLLIIEKSSKNLALVSSYSQITIEISKALNNAIKFGNDNFGQMEQEISNIF